jgi:hypothetical protein
MTPGSKVLLALIEAEATGTKPGIVLITPGKRGNYFGLIVNVMRFTVFVLEKWSITHLSDEKEILPTFTSPHLHFFDPFLYPSPSSAFFDPFISPVSAFFCSFRIPSPISAFFDPFLSPSPSSAFWRFSEMSG